MTSRNTSTSDILLEAVSSRVDPEERLDVLLHALAQLPSHTRGRLWGTGPDRGRLELTAAAYGLGTRMVFEDGIPSSLEGTIVCTSARNLELLPRGLLEEQANGHVLEGGTATPSRFKDHRTLAALVETIDPRGSGLNTWDASSGLSGERVVIITNIPTHYRVPLFSRLDAYVRAAGGRLSVLFLALTYERRSWMEIPPMDFEHRVLKSPGFMVGKERRVFVPLDLERALSEASPTILLVAGFSPAVALRAARYCRRTNTPLGVWTGEIPATAPNSPLRIAIRRLIVNRCTFGVAYGHKASEYLRSIRNDLPFILSRNTTPMPQQRAKTPAEPVNILTVGALTNEGKRIELLIDAIRLLPELPCRLTVVGGGHYLPILQERARGLEDRVIFTGALAPTEVHVHYHRAHIVAFPSSYDIFGLVIVEAMGTGAAVAVSSHPGAVSDLCVSGENSIVVKNDDAASWAVSLRALILDGEFRSRLGDRAARTIHGRWTMEHSADAMAAGIRLGVLSGRTR